MNERTHALAAVVGAAVLALVLAIYFLVGDRDDDPSAAAEGGSSAESAAGDGWEDDDELFGAALSDGLERAPDAPRRGRSEGSGGMGGGGSWSRGGSRDGPVGDDLESRRARRRERFLSRIDISNLGAETPTITNEDVFDGFRAVRPLVRDCLRASGIGRGGWRTMRATARTMTFDLDAEGGVLPESVSIDPPPPEPYAGCFVSGLEVLTTEPPGGEGARVTIDFPARRNRRGRDAGPR